MSQQQIVWSGRLCEKTGCVIGCQKMQFEQFLCKGETSYEKIICPNIAETVAIPGPIYFY
jgi:hypothetical protein